MSDVQDLRQLGYPIKLDKERYLVFDLGAMANFQERYGSFDEVFDAIVPEDGKMDVVELRYVLHQGLLYEDPELTEADVQRMVTTRNIEEVAGILGDALVGALPEIEGDAEKN